MEKITVALTPSVVQRARKAVKAGRARSLSALVNALLDEQLRRDELTVLFNEWDDERGPPSAEDQSWARALLDR